MLRHFSLICLLCSTSARLACFILCAGKSTDSYQLYHTSVSCCSVFPQCFVWFLYFLPPHVSLDLFLAPFNYSFSLFLKLYIVSAALSWVQNLLTTSIHVVYDHLKCQVCSGWPLWPFLLSIGKEWRCWWLTSRSQQKSSPMDAPRSSLGTQER